jgi:hypothetical protein
LVFSKYDKLDEKLATVRDHVIFPDFTGMKRTKRKNEKKERKERKEKHSVARNLIICFIVLIVLGPYELDAFTHFVLNKFKAADKHTGVPRLHHAINSLGAQSAVSFVYLFVSILFFIL